MKPVIEPHPTSPENPINLPVEVPAMPKVIIEIPDITPEEVIDPIIDLQPDNYNEAVDNLVAKYSKT
ncbi:hypothetical protein BH11BAC3_BH11BAC3_24180 [soil metagenome]